MSAFPSSDDIFDSGRNKAQVQTSLEQFFDAVNQRIGDGSGTAAEKAASRTALDTSRGMQPIDGTVAASALTLTLSPTNLEFRHATLSNGTVNIRTVAAALNLVISSGSTLGTVSGVASRIALLAIDNAGTVELAAVNANGGFHFDESQLITTTAEGGAGAADSAAVVYSTTARSNVPFRFVGYVESTQGTAGTWTTPPSKKQGGGGALLALFKAMQISTSTTIATTSGTSIDFTGVPSYAKRAWLMLNGVSTNGSDALLFQLGDAGGVETSGYASNALTAASGSAAATSNSTAGFVTAGGASAANAYSGVIEFMHAGGNVWVCHGSLANTGDGRFTTTAGGKTLSEILTQIRMTTTAGTNTFDGGSATLAWQ